MMNFKPAHFCFGLVFLIALASLFYSPSQNAISASPQPEATEVDPSASEESAVDPESVDEPIVALETSSVTPETAEDEAISEPATQAEGIQTDSSIVSIAQSEISVDEWQVVESELAEFYIQKNSSSPDSIAQSGISTLEEIT
ncbi:MAG: hypothetical protein QNJ46_31495 [Leptolyngbyaceae cyanobacterium MO_188.B28]|nr:hypothetical protein [Leptolyngbyaceae cyanobacterium MO_188.B28]